MTIEIRENADQIIWHLKKLGRPVVRLMQSGLPSSEICTALSDFGISPHPQLVEFYATYNGTKVLKGDVLDDLHFFPGFYWMSLKDACNSYRAFRNDNRWNKAWFPIFGNGGGDFYAMVCDEKSPDYGAIIGFILGETDHPIEYVDLNSMLKTIDKCYKQGGYFLENGYLDADDMKVYVIAKENNPGLEFYLD